MGDSGQDRGCPWQVWGGEELDWVPTQARLYLRGVGRRYLTEWPFNEAYERLLRDYRPRRRYRLLLFIPCSYGKPYSQSYIHYLMRTATAPYIKRGLLHEVIVTNAGVVPRELDEYWPFTAYDWNPHMETPEVRECYRSVLADRIHGYLERFIDYYEMVAAYLRWDSDSWAALREAARRVGLEVENIAPRSVSRREIEEAGLGLPEYMQDPDLALVTRTALEKLRRRLEELLGEP